MKDDKKILICGSDGNDAQVLFTFECADGSYVVTEDQNDEEDPLTCGALGWNIWKGAYVKNREVDGHALSVAQRLNDKYYANGGTGTRGEHYEVIEGEPGRRMIRRNGKGMLRPFLRFIPVAFRIFVAVAMAILSVCFYLNAWGVMWIRTLLPELDNRYAEALIWAAQAACTLGLLYIKNGRVDASTLFITAFVPLNAITVLGAVKSSNVIRYAVILGCVILLAVFVVPKIINGIKANCGEARKEELGKAATSACLGLAILMSVCVIGVQLLGVNGYTNESSGAGSYEKSEEVREKYIDLRSKLDIAVWKKLTVQEKLEVLQGIADYESIFVLGCNTSHVRVGVLEHETTLACYSHAERVITVNEKHLKEGQPGKVVDSLLHEVRHAWQHTVVEMYVSIEDDIDERFLSLAIFREAEEYKNNLLNYVDGNKDFDAYYEQAIEEDSRQWSEQRLKETYYSFIYGDR